MADFLCEGPAGRGCVRKDGFEEVFHLGSHVRYDLAVRGDPAYKREGVTGQ